MKTCYKCKKTKSESEFCKDKSRRDGLQARCKECDKTTHSKYYVNNAEKVCTDSLKYRENNKETIRARMQSYYLTNRDKILKRCSNYRKNNVMKIKLRNKKYRIANLKQIYLRGVRYREATQETQKWYRHTRRGRERQAKGSFTSLDIKTLLITQNSKCIYCQIELITKGAGIYHVDHIMPLKLGGSNFPDNLQLLCPTCNLSKGHKHPDVYEKEINYNRNKE